MKCISNIKVSFQFCKVENWNVILKKKSEILKFSYKQSVNIFSVKYKYSFCFFEKKNNKIHVNATGIKSFHDLQSFTSFFTHNLFNVILENFQIDNITASFNIKENIDLKKLKEITLNSKYNPDNFPGLFLTLEKRTFIIFKNGKIILLGCKTEKEIHNKWQLLLQIILHAIIMKQT